MTVGWPASQIAISGQLPKCRREASSCELQSRPGSWRRTGCRYQACGKSADLQALRPQSTSQNAAHCYQTGPKQRHGTSVLHRRCHQSLTSSEESTCDGKARPKQNQARGLRRDVRLDENAIRHGGASSVPPCDGTNQLRRSVLDGVASRKKTKNHTRPQTVRLTQRIRTVGSKREGNTSSSLTLTVRIRTWERTTNKGVTDFAYRAALAQPVNDACRVCADKGGQ